MSAPVDVLHRHWVRGFSGERREDLSAVGTDPVLCDRYLVRAAVAAARNPVIVSNALTRPGGYSPYCMRCRGLQRMAEIGFLRWRHYCGAEHDEPEARAALIAFHRFPHDACRRAQPSPAPLRQTHPQRREVLATPLGHAARLQRVTLPYSARPGAAPAFWSMAYRDEFVQRAAMSLGFCGLFVVWLARWQGVL